MSESITFRVSILDQMSSEMKRIRSLTESSFKNMTDTQKKYSSAISDTQEKIIGLNKESLTATKERQKEISKEISLMNKLKTTYSNALKVENLNQPKGITSIGEGGGKFSGLDAMKLGGFSDIGGGIVNMAMDAGQAIFEFGKESLEAAAKYERFQAVLKSALGSSTGAIESMQMIQDIASQTPFSVEQLTNSYIKLVNRGFQPTESEIVKLGDLAASQGKDFDQLSEALLDAETFEFERMKEFGIKFKTEGDKLKVTFKGQTETIDKSSASVRDYILSLGDMSGVQGLMATVSETTSGKISNLGDNIDILKNNIGQELLPVQNQLLDIFNKTIGTMNGIMSVPLSQKIREQKIEFNALANTLSRVKDNTSLYNTTLAQITAKFPEYSSMLDEEIKKYGSVEKAIAAVNAELDKKYKLQVQSEYVSFVDKEAATLNKMIVDFQMIGELAKVDKDMAATKFAKLKTDIMLQGAAKGEFGTLIKGSLGTPETIMNYLLSEQGRVSKLQGKGYQAAKENVTAYEAEQAAILAAKNKGDGTTPKKSDWFTPIQSEVGAKLQWFGANSTSVLNDRQKQILADNEQNIAKIIGIFEKNKQSDKYKDTQEYKYLDLALKESMQKVEAIRGGKVGDMGSTELSTQRNIKSLTVNITKMVGIENANTTTVQESADVVANSVLRLLSRSVADSNNQLNNF